MEKVADVATGDATTAVARVEKDVPCIFAPVIDRRPSCLLSVDHEVMRGRAARPHLDRAVIGTESQHERGRDENRPCLRMECNLNAYIRYMKFGRPGCSCFPFILSLSTRMLMSMSFRIISS